MSDSYLYRKPVHHRHGSSFGRFFGITLAIILLIAAIAGGLIYDLRHSNSKAQPVSSIQTQQVTDQSQTFRNAYFQFSDSGKWVLDTQDSSADKFVYYKYRGLIVEYQLIVYVNQVPIPLYLASSRVLPVRIVNDNSFDVTTVSDGCNKMYGPNDLHKIKEVTINQATMLCDPDTPQYSVVLAQIDGNYQLHLKRLDGTPVQMVVTFRDLTLQPQPDEIQTITSSFQAL